MYAYIVGVEICVSYVYLLFSVHVHSLCCIHIGLFCIHIGLFCVCLVSCINIQVFWVKISVSCVYL